MHTWSIFAIICILILDIRVHPLPEALMDYVWDFGALHSKDEISYIKSIMSVTFEQADLLELLVVLISESQECITTTPTPPSTPAHHTSSLHIL
jgi:hypothetical protein